MDDLWHWLQSHIETALSTTLAAAIAGRLAWHTRLVRADHRKFFSAELLLEIPIVFVMWYIGIGFAAWMGWEGPVAGGVVAVAAYMGPGGLQTLLQKYVEAKVGEKK